MQEPPRQELCGSSSSAAPHDAVIQAPLGVREKLGNRGAKSKRACEIGSASTRKQAPRGLQASAMSDSSAGHGRETRQPTQSRRSRCHGAPDAGGLTRPPGRERAAHRAGDPGRWCARVRSHRHRPEQAWRSHGPRWALACLDRAQPSHPWLSIGARARYLIGRETIWRCRPALDRNFARAALTSATRNARSGMFSASLPTRHVIVRDKS
jgi:hypothetical protein